MCTGTVQVRMEARRGRGMPWSWSSLQLWPLTWVLWRDSIHMSIIFLPRPSSIRLNSGPLKAICRTLWFLGVVCWFSDDGFVGAGVRLPTRETFVRILASTAVVHILFLATRMLGRPWMIWRRIIFSNFIFNQGHIKFSYITIKLMK